MKTFSFFEWYTVGAIWRHCLGVRGSGNEGPEPMKRIDRTPEVITQALKHLPLLERPNHVAILAGIA
jgi:hypothetical protein